MHLFTLLQKGQKVTKLNIFFQMAHPADCFEISISWCADFESYSPTTINNQKLISIQQPIRELYLYMSRKQNTS